MKLFSGSTTTEQAMDENMGKWIVAGRTILFFLCVMLLVCTQSFAAVKANQTREVRHLIQTTNYQDEYEGLLYLDLLRIHPLEEPDVDNIYERVAPAVVRISMAGYAGSGIVTALSSDKVIILSNKHLLEHAGEGMVTFWQGFEVPGSVSRYSTAYDMAVLEVEIKDISYEQLANLRYVTMRDAATDGALMAGDPVVLIGSVETVAGNCEQGIVKNPAVFELDFYTEMLEIEARAVPGMSGGVACDAYGRMVGMITGNSVVDEDMTYCLPVERME